jgi:hypothetical protein
VIADGQILDALADLGDDPGALVTTQHRIARNGEVTGHQMVVGMAQAGRLQLNGHLTATGIADLDLVDRPRLVQFPDQRTFCLQRLASAFTRTA